MTSSAGWFGGRCRRRRLAKGGLLTLALLPACQLGPRRRADAIDPQVYAVCDDAEGSAAYARAQRALERGDDAAALPHLITATERCPDLVRAHLAYQDAARRLGGEAAQAMVDRYSRAEERDSPVPAYLKARLAETAYAQGSALDAILARWPSFAWAHLSRARVQRSQGRLLPALDGYALAIVNDPDLHEARLERAQVLAELGRAEEAAAEYAKYFRARPDDHVALRAYASLLLYQLGRTEQALQHLDHLAATEGNSLPLRMDRAAAMWRSGRTREAVEGYLAVLEEAPATARAALNIGLLYYEVAPRTDAERRLFWPKARAAFRLFLEHSQPADGHEQFEHTWFVPYRLRRIAELLGPAPEDAPRLQDLRWPVTG